MTPVYKGRLLVSSKETASEQNNVHDNEECKHNKENKQEQRDAILSYFPDALCAEMEGAAIGHVCTRNGIPFCILRTMSDAANSESKVDYSTFSKKAGEASAAVLIRMFFNQKA